MKTLLIAAAAFASISGAALANSDQYDQRGGTQVLEENYGQASSFDYAPTASITDNNPLIETEMERRNNR